MSIDAISSSQQKEFIKNEKINPWKKICKLAWNILLGSSFLINSMIFVSDPSILLLTTKSIVLYTGSLFISTMFIFCLINYSFNHFKEVMKNSEDLYYFWKGHEINKV